MLNRIIKIDLTARSSDLVIPLADIKESLIVTHDDDDALIERIFKGVCDAVESKTKRLLSEGTVICTIKNYCNQILLPRIPVISITGIERFKDNAWVAFTDFSNTYDSSIICINNFGDFRITYQAGYNVDNLLPQGLKDVLLAETAYRYENRGDKLRQDGLCSEADKLITQYLNLSWL